MVKGYLQKFGVDFDQTFAAVVKPVAFRVFFILAAFFDLDIDQMDIKTAFLYGLIDQLIYIEMPRALRPMQIVIWYANFEKSCMA